MKPFSAGELQRFTFPLDFFAFSWSLKRARYGMKNWKSTDKQYANEEAIKITFRMRALQISSPAMKTSRTFFPGARRCRFSNRRKNFETTFQFVQKSLIFIYARDEINCRLSSV